MQSDKLCSIEIYLVPAPLFPANYITIWQGHLNPIPED